MEKVCTVIVTYNGTKWIEKCMQHLTASEYPTSIIVIDNHSTDNTLDLLAPYLSKIELIKSEKNLGFGGGNNIGIKKALELNAAFIFLLNQDAYVSKECIGLLVTAFRNNPSYGIISPLQLDNTGSQLDETFKKYLKNIIPETQLEALLSNNFSGAYSPLLPVRFVNAAAWMISKATIEKVGVFHPVFYHYGEDNHYSSRLQYHQFKIGVLANATIIHDRNDEKLSQEKLLLRKLKTVPLYTLLDVRKAFPMAYLSGFLKLKRIKKKLSALHSKNIDEVFREQKKWFTVKLKEAIQIRKESKKVCQSL